MLENGHKDITIRKLESVDCNVRVKGNNRNDKLVKNNTISRKISLVAVFLRDISQFNLIKKKKKRKKTKRDQLNYKVIA